MMKSTLFTNKLHGSIDKFGAVISLACAIHCIAIPLLIALLPLSGLSFLLDQTIEKIFLIPTICLAAFSLCWGFLIHKKIQALLVYAAAASMIICAVFILPHHHHGHENYHNLALTSASESATSHHGHPQSDPFGLLLLLAGGSAIALSHLLNRHFCKSCVRCQEHHHH